MRVIKVGGGCLNGRETIASILDLMTTRGPGHVFVVSALHGVTDFLFSSLKTALNCESQIPELIDDLKTRHLLVARHLIPRKPDFKDYRRELEKSLGQLARLYYGLNFTQAITPRLIDAISSYGERFAAQLLASAVCSRGVSATYRMPHKVGLITDGKYGDATADLTKTARQFKIHLSPLIGSRKILFLPGFFGASERGEITTFGRGGSDYAAAVVAVALDAEQLDIWKDTEGFMSADPRLVPEA
jgi:aspartate kinase